MQDVWISGINWVEELTEECTITRLKLIATCSNTKMFSPIRFHYMFLPMYQKRHMMLWYLQDMFRLMEK